MKVLGKTIWIGERSLILKRSKIGNNSIIGAGSVVTGEIPPNSVYAGNPAKFIKELNEQEFIMESYLRNLQRI